MKEEQFAIVLFDGVCNFCNSSVQFIIDRDPARHFRFAPLQSTVGQSLLRAHGLDPNQLSTMVLVHGGKIYLRSTAALRIARGLRQPWPWLYGLVLFPRFLRDAAYSWFAARRYQWFGKSEACRLPTPEFRSRFLDHPAAEENPNAE